MKRSEIVALHRDHPDLFARALAIEDSFRTGPHYRRASLDGRAGKAITKGLGRNWSWRAFYESGFETRTERRKRIAAKYSCRFLAINCLLWVCAKRDEFKRTIGLAIVHSGAPPPSNS